MQKIWVVVLAVVSLSLTTTATTAGAAPARAAGTDLTIQAWPEGVFGYVRSSAPERCASKRQIEVFEQLGARRDPASDRRISSDRAGDGGTAHQWAVRTSRAGRLYAVAPKLSGCAAAESGGLETGALQGAAEPDDYPACGPYVSEGSTYICKFKEMHVGFQESCSFADGSGNCEGKGKSGLFPWGVRAQGGNPDVQFFWTWGNNRVTVVSYRPDQDRIGTAFLSGTMPGPSKDGFSISDAFAQNDRGREIGDHFYTPDLPGQTAGQVGGPLSLSVVATTPFDAQLYISGYLYLRR